MAALPTLTVDRTHLFPGARLRAEGTDLDARSDVVVLFSDGARTEGAVIPTADGAELRVGAYRTEAGTDIGAKSWQLGPGPEGTLRVIRRA